MHRTSSSTPVRQCRGRRIPMVTCQLSAFAPQRRIRGQHTGGSAARIATVFIEKNDSSSTERAPFYHFDRIEMKRHFLSLPSDLSTTSPAPC